MVDDGETDEDLVRDMVEVLTWMCARLYGRRGPLCGARNRALRAVTATNTDRAADAADGDVAPASHDGVDG